MWVLTPPVNPCTARPGPPSDPGQRPEVRCRADPVLKRPAGPPRSRGARPCARTTPRVARTPYLYGRWAREWEATAMPTYAYRCEQCGETFDRIESISEHGTAKPACPKCGSDKIASVPTAFVAVTGKKS